MASGPTRHLQGLALVVESRSDYALDYELMLNGLGYAAVFAPTGAAAGLAMLEHPDIALALVDADSVDLECCVRVMTAIRPVPLIAVGSQEISFRQEISSNIRLCRKPIFLREVERAIVQLRNGQDP
jgi:CheY-like chemotaxis protein